jgi:hypothetical protein
MRLVKNLSDWEIKREIVDFPADGITHTLWETNNEEFGFYFYLIDEYGLMKNLAKLQILRNKKDPKMIYDSKRVNFTYNPYQELFTEYDWTDKGFLVLRQVLNGGYKLPVIIINLYESKFISFDKFYVKLNLENRILTIEETVVSKIFKKEEIIVEKIDLDKTDWLSLDKLI